MLNDIICLLGIADRQNNYQNVRILSISAPFIEPPFFHRNIMSSSYVISLLVQRPLVLQPHLGLTSKDSVASPLSKW